MLRRGRRRTFSKTVKVIHSQAFKLSKNETAIGIRAPNGQSGLSFNMEIATFLQFKADNLKSMNSCGLVNLQKSFVTKKKDEQSL